MQSGDVTVTAPVAGTSKAQAVWPIGGGGGGAIIVEPVASATQVVTGVAQSVADVVLKAANANRIGITIANDTTSSAILYVRVGGTAATVASGGYTVAIQPGGYWEAPFRPTTAIHGIWGGAGPGFANVTEFT